MPISRIKTGLITAVMLVVFAAPFQVSAQEKPTSFKDWGYKCETPKAINKEICYIFQRITNKENNQKIADVTVAYPPNVDKPVMVITLPLGVFLPTGIQIRVDENKEKARAPYVQCIKEGCQASAPLDDKMMGMMKAGSRMQVDFFTPQRKQLGFPISLNGFTAAVQSLKK